MSSIRQFQFFVNMSTQAHFAQIFLFILYIFMNEIFQECYEACRVTIGIPLRENPLSCGHPPFRGNFRHTPTKVSPMGSPPKPNVSGFGGERRSKKVNGAFRPKGGNRVHGLCDDAGGGAKRRRGSIVPQGHHNYSFFFILSYLLFFPVSPNRGAAR